MSAEAPQALDYSWLHDDAEEDLVGADWHQNAIHALSTSLKTFAEDRRLPWHVGDQLTMVGQKPDGSLWRASPDVSVHPTLGPAERQDIDVREDGPPALVVEVASSSTWQYDVSLESTRRGKRRAGKAFGYLVMLRIPEYLVFDPREEFLLGQVRAWRCVGDLVQEWPPDDDGRYHSRALDMFFRPDGPCLRVLDQAGIPVPFWFEASRENVALRQANEELARRNAALEAELEQLRRIRDSETFS